jgi:GAF domain-containing protein
LFRSAARRLTGADGATFVLRDNDTCYYVDEDAISPLWKGQRFPINICVSGWTMLNKQSAIIEDIYNDERIPIEAYRPTFVKSLLMVPIRSMSPIGAIGNYWAQPHEPTPMEIELLQSLANITSVSMENIQAFQDLATQNNVLKEIAFLQAHQVRAPIARILGLSQLFNRKDLQDPENSEILTRLLSTTKELDDVIKDIVKKTNEIE